MRRDETLSVDERVELGKAARKALPRSDHAEYAPTADRADPVATLRAQDTTRLPDLVPIRYGRMLSSPFAFYRGSAVLMADDLGAAPSTGLFAHLCGDAHLSNFGVFASPDRRLVFDINDFDETLPGPWEWDVKRLVASMIVAARSLTIPPRERELIARATAAAYHERMRELSEMRNLDVWYARTEAEQIKAMLDDGKKQDATTLKRLTKYEEKAYTRDNLHTFKKLVKVVDGEPEFISDPPLVMPVHEILTPGQYQGLLEHLRSILRQYQSTLSTDRRHLLHQFHLVHIARKVVGVGSVGTRCWILLMLGRDSGDPPFLQVKEAGPSVLEPVLGPSEYRYAGERVVAGQRVMQAASDILLGWQNAVDIEGVEREYYVRQLKDWKGSAVIENMDVRRLMQYGELCGRVLARAHARSGDRIAIAAYLGKSDTFERAVAAFAEKYADQAERDFAELEQAERDGAIDVMRGV